MSEHKSFDSLREMIDTDPTLRNNRAGASRGADLLSASTLSAWGVLAASGVQKVPLFSQYPAQG